ncbi:MAG: hypothetical protein EPN37_11535 [Chitinophagaceae bacterium]|nr:MAG: hypothetical protein EPN37_11535 [Chitinophagaceae bacterium]
MKIKDIAIIFILLLFAAVISCQVVTGQQLQRRGIITPGSLWLDNNRNTIQAHGGGIILVGSTYYWFGEDRAQGLDPLYKYVGCYSSEDLVHWTFLSKIKFAAPKGFDPHHWVLERPKVYYNRKTKKYVMYFHLDDARYKAAEIGIAVSNDVDSGYQFVKHFRPFGMESRDIGQFIDDDGTAYLIFESRPTHGFVIARLSDDYMSVEKKMCLVKEPLEGGALVHYKGLYYVIGSHLTGWNPNSNVYATAKKVSGPWSPFKNMAPSETNTYGSQSTMLLKVTGTKKATVIYMGDIWKPAAQWDSRYLWMPLKIGKGKLWLPKPEPWEINIKTGFVKFANK